MALKTDLPDQITTAAEARTFLSELVTNSEIFNPDDDIDDIEWDQCEAPSEEQKVQLKKLMVDIWSLEDFDVHGYLLSILFPEPAI